MNKSEVIKARIEKSQKKFVHSECERFGIEESTYLRRVLDKEMGKSVNVSEGHDAFIRRKKIAHIIEKLRELANATEDREDSVEIQKIIKLIEDL